MTKDLTNSQVDRRNVLNNNMAISEAYKQIGFRGVMFENKYRFTKRQVARYYEVDERTIERLLESHGEELTNSGYELFTGTRLRSLKNALLASKHAGHADVSDIDVGDIPDTPENEGFSLRAPSIGIFTFKAFLNLGMLLTGSDRAQKLRSALLDIVIDVLNQRLGGTTKFINQREEEFLPSAIREYNYRQEFTNALDFYIEPNKFKYSHLTDRIYKSIFHENSKEYRQILSLSKKESVRSTMYAEILDLIAGYENGYADILKKRYETLGRKLTLTESLSLFKEFEQPMQAFIAPLREKARSLMASRDLAFRDALHEKLKEYINEVSAEDFEKFLGERSMDLEKRLEDNKDVFKRLKER